MTSIFLCHDGVHVPSDNPVQWGWGIGAVRPPAAGSPRRGGDERPDAFVFPNSDGGRIDLSNFSRDVWNDARRDTFPAGSPLRNVLRHDLRHSAITAWLNGGVRIKTAQVWSGHRTASTLLDTLPRVMRPLGAPGSIVT